MAQESATTLFRDAKDRAALAEREAWERVSRVEADSAVRLTSAHEEVEGLARRIAHLEDELVEAHRAREMTKENSQGLSDAAVDAV
jgi:hypothetical protein